jgi:hypothetical protein
MVRHPGGWILVWRDSLLLLRLYARVWKDRAWPQRGAGLMKMKTFKCALVGGWIAFGAAVTALVVSPEVFTRIFNTVTLKLMMLGLVCATAIYRLVRMYLAGMRQR